MLSRAATSAAERMHLTSLSSGWGILIDVNQQCIVYLDRTSQLKSSTDLFTYIETRLNRKPRNEETS